MVAFNIISMTCFKLVSASSSSSSSSSSEHARRFVATDREGDLLQTYRVVVLPEKWRGEEDDDDSEQYQVNWRCLSVFTCKSRLPSVSILWLSSWKEGLQMMMIQLSIHPSIESLRPSLQFTWYCSDLHLLLLVPSLIDDDDDVLTSLTKLMEMMMNATMSCSSSSSDGRGRGGWE